MKMKKQRRIYKKAMSTVDYAVAAAIFLIIFASIVYLTTNYFTSLRKTTT